ncbi:MAG: Uma2 family endonuclease [Lachnospiraceae bacterium]|nr:Uma2 family endonuclease [Lachnospiraceae bacterium]
MSIEGGKSYTIADIEALPDGERAELIDGEMFIMESPSMTHQKILGELHVQIYMHIKNNKGPCEVFLAPFAVYIANDTRNYVEPDIVVICQDDKLDEKGCHGAPDWIIEITSPSNKYMDYGRKLMLYQAKGVREYWIVDPKQKYVTVYDFEHGEGPIVHSFSEPVKVHIYENLSIDLRQFM